MTTNHGTGKSVLRLFLLYGISFGMSSNLSLVLCHPANSQDYKPGDPIRFGGVHKPMSSTSPASTYTAAPAYAAPAAYSAPAAPSFAAPDARSLSPVTSPTSYNPASSMPGTIGGGGYSAPPTGSFGALPPGELQPAPGSAAIGQGHPAPYTNPQTHPAQSFNQPAAKTANKHQHTSKPPRQAQPAQSSGGSGGDSAFAGFWKAMAQPFKWVGGLFK